MLRRDQRFVPEKHEISRQGLVRLLFACLATVGAAAILIGGAHFAWTSFFTAGEREVVIMEPIKETWKRVPEDRGGRKFLNKGLEINHVQAKLFDLPEPEEIVLAPPPAGF